MPDQNPARIAPGKVVSIQFRLTDEEGELLDQSEESEPLLYLHGSGNIVPGLERALEGKAVGDQLKVRVPPGEGYGDHDPSGVHSAMRSDFPEGEELEEGTQFLAEDGDGNVVPVWVTGVDGDAITVDFNHPLAGVTLDFDVIVAEVRDATEDERNHGHPHGPGGHEH